MYRLLKNDIETDRSNTFEERAGLDLEFKVRSSNIKDFFFENGVFYTALDSRFNNLRYEKTNTEGRSIVGAYLTILLEMIHSVYQSQFEESSPIKEWNTLFELLEKQYPLRERKDNSYYEILRKADLDSCSYKLATTNYTKYIYDACNDIDENQIAFLHGKLTWFEDRKNLIIYDLENSSDKENLNTIVDKNDTLIPFILIPSGVKPIICTKQLLEYAKFIHQLEKSNTLCVLGYRLNSEDNDINSIISKWLRSSSNNRLVVFNHKESIDLARVLWIPNCDRKRDTSSSGRENNWIINQLNGQVTEIIVDDGNSKKAFASFLRDYKEGILDENK